MILSAIAAKLKRQAKGDFKGRHFEAALIVQAVSQTPQPYRSRYISLVAVRVTLHTPSRTVWSAEVAV